MNNSIRKKMFTTRETSPKANHKSIWIAVGEKPSVFPPSELSSARSASGKVEVFGLKENIDIRRREKPVARYKKHEFLWWAKNDFHLLKRTFCARKYWWRSEFVSEGRKKFPICESTWRAGVFPRKNKSQSRVCIIPPSAATIWLGK